MESSDSECREDSSSEDSHPSSEDSVDVRVGVVLAPPPHTTITTTSPTSPSSSSTANPLPKYSPPPPLLSLIRGRSPSSPRLPPKLRKRYNSLAAGESELLKPNPVIAAAFAAAVAYDRTPPLAAVNSKQQLLSSNHDAHHNNNNSSPTVQHARRRKPAEPRRLCANDGYRKRAHSPSPDRLQYTPSPNHNSRQTAASREDVPPRPIKVPKLSPCDRSPLSASQRTPSPSIFTSPIPGNPSAPPLIHPSILSPLVRPPHMSPTLTSTIASHLLPQGWPAATNPYQHFPRLLGLHSPLALLPGSLSLPHYPLVPLLHHQIPPQPSQIHSSPSSPQSFHISPKLSPSEALNLSPGLKCSQLDNLKCQDEPVSLVKREENKATRQLFTVLSLVGDARNESSSKEDNSPSKLPPIPPQPPPKAPLSPSHTPSSAPSVNTSITLTSNKLSNKSNTQLKIKEDKSSRDEDIPPIPSGLRPSGSSRGGKSESVTPSVSPLDKYSDAQQSQQQQARNKQRNYKNMTRERRIEANARERTRVHTISSAYEKLRQSIPSYSHNQKLSKLSILRIAASYIMTLDRMANDGPEEELASCVEDTTRTIQFEGRAKKKRED